MDVAYVINDELQKNILYANFVSGTDREKYFKTYIKKYFTSFSHSIDSKEAETGNWSRYRDNTSSSDRDAEIYRKMQKNIIENKKPILYGLLKESDYEMGFESKAEKYFNELYRKYETTADTILQNIYLENLDKNTHVLKEIIFIIAELPKNRRKNLAYIAIAGLSNESDEVKDLSIRCFEAWNEKKYLSILKNHVFRSRRLEEYKKEVIRSLETDGE